MTTKWEYILLRIERNFSSKQGTYAVVVSLVNSAGKITALDSASGPSSWVGSVEAVEYLNKLGESGWELAGPPEVQNEVGRPPGSEFDRNFWVERCFWLKRGVA